MDKNPKPLKQILLLSFILGLIILLAAGLINLTGSWLRPASVNTTVSAADLAVDNPYGALKHAGIVYYFVGGTPLRLFRIDPATGVREELISAKMPVTPDSATEYFESADNSIYVLTYTVCHEFNCGYDPRPYQLYRWDLTAKQVTALGIRNGLPSYQSFKVQNSNLQLFDSEGALIDTLEITWSWNPVTE